MNFVRGAYRRRRRGRDAQPWRDANRRCPPPCRSPTARRFSPASAPSICASPADAGAGLPARIELIEPMGLTTLIHVSVAGEPLKVLSFERQQLGPGAQVGIDRGRRPAAPLRPRDRAAAELSACPAGLLQCSNDSCLRSSVNPALLNKILNNGALEPLRSLAALGGRRACRRRAACETQEGMDEQIPRILRCCWPRPRSFRAWRSAAPAPRTRS